MELNPSHKALIRRYLIWAYKSTKESFDRLERKATQLVADEHILSVLVKDTPSLDPSQASVYMGLLEEFHQYILKKKNTPVPQAQHVYLKNRLNAVESAIVKFLGNGELKKIRAGYEEEFVRRIWEAKDGH